MINDISINPNDKDWQVFEKVAAQFEKTLAPNAKVMHNDKIKGINSKKDRQIDISIRSRIGPHEILIIAECKKYKNKIDLPDVEAFVAKLRDVKASKGVIISNAGFTDGAITLAKNSFIDLCSLFDAENKDWGTKVEIPTIFDYRSALFSARLIIPPSKEKHPGVFLPTDLLTYILMDEKNNDISLKDLFFRDWNNSKMSCEVGEYTHKPTYPYKLLAPGPKGYAPIL
jgi:hypothetical protein